MFSLTFLIILSELPGTYSMLLRAKLNEGVEDPWADWAAVSCACWANRRMAELWNGLRASGSVLTLKVRRDEISEAAVCPAPVANEDPDNDAQIGAQWHNSLGRPRQAKRVAVHS